MYERTGRVNERRRELSQGSSSGMGGTEQRHREQGQRLSEGGRRERRRRRSLREAASLTFEAYYVLYLMFKPTRSTQGRDVFEKLSTNQVTMQDC